MQLLANGRDQVAKSYMEKSKALHRLVDGTFQFGTGKTASVVSAVEQVSEFNEDVQTEVEAWLASGGYQRGMEAKRAIDLAESSQSMPGSIEALAAELGGQDLLGKLFALLQAAAKGTPIQAGKGIVNADQPLPAGVMRPDRSVKSIIVDDEEGEGSDDLSEFMPDLSLEQPTPDILPRTAAAMKPEAPVAPSAPSPDVMASLSAIAEGMGAIMQRLETLEQKPVPANKRPRPSRSKHMKAPAP